MKLWPLQRVFGLCSWISEALSNGSSVRSVARQRLAVMQEANDEMSAVCELCLLHVRAYAYFNVE